MCDPHYKKAYKKNLFAAKYIGEKMKLATAIAVIKTKPNTMTLQEHIETLKLNINNENTNPDLNITLGSEDFDISNGISDVTHDFDQIIDNDDMNDSVTILDDQIGFSGDVNEGEIHVSNVLRDLEVQEMQTMSENPQCNQMHERIIDEIHYVDDSYNPTNTYLPSDLNITSHDNEKSNLKANSLVKDSSKKPDNRSKFHSKIRANISKNIDKEFKWVGSEQEHLDEAEAIYKNDKVEICANISKNIDKEFKKVVYEQELIDEYAIYNRKAEVDKTVKPKDLPNSIDSQETQFDTTSNLLESLTHISQSQIAVESNILRTYIYGVNRDNDILNKDINNANDSELKAMDTEDHTTNINIEITNTENATDPNLHINPSDIENTDDEQTSSQKELIPFKVIEELNKVKSFLRRLEGRSCDGFSSDSGYRSDSQGRSRQALQLSGVATNQSAFCLFNFISNCRLMNMTQDITYEISKVLGHLIDSLHEEEKYPSFLEELLEHVDILLKRIYDEQTYCENQLLSKDEDIQRILILNKSIHIQKYTIDKITDILNVFHIQMTNLDEDFEIRNIKNIENLAYLFHILEILVKRYQKSKDNSSQSTATSQEFKLKRSSITDIWRKKWNPQYKISQTEGTIEKCVLTKCSEVLNKLIVHSMDKFSLIAYSALQCYNSIQN